MRNVVKSRSGRSVISARCAASTFSVYLFHYPMVLAIAGTGVRNSLSLPAALAMLVGVLIVCALLSLVTERRKDVLARMADRLL